MLAGFGDSVEVLLVGHERLGSRREVRHVLVEGGEDEGASRGPG